MHCSTHPLWLSLLLLLLTLGCADDDRLDGTWRQTSGGPAVGDRSYELVLGQYGGDVAGLVREYDALELGGGTREPYGSERYCRPLERGGFRSDVLSLFFKDTNGEVLRFGLVLEKDDLLVGQLSGVDQASGQALTFERIGDAVDKDCDWINELVINGLVELDLSPEQTPRAAVLYLGTQGGAPCQATGVGRDELPAGGGGQRFFSLTISRRPPSCSLVELPGELSLAWGLFVVYDDQNGDGRWSWEDLPGSSPEPLLGLSRQHALLYLDGDPRDLATDPAGVLDGFEAQSYSLVQIAEADATRDPGRVLALHRIPDAQVSSTPVRVLPADGDHGPAPRLRLQAETP